MAFCVNKTKQAKAMKKIWRWLKNSDGAEGVPIFGHGCQTPSSWLFLSSFMIYLCTVITNTSGATELYFFLQPTGRARLKWSNTSYEFKPVFLLLFFPPPFFFWKCRGVRRWLRRRWITVAILPIRRRFHFDHLSLRHVSACGFHDVYLWRSCVSFETRMKLVSPRWFAHAGSR